MKSPKDIRHRARMKLVETLYAELMNPQTQPLEEDNIKYDKKLFEQIYSLFKIHLIEIDKLIEKESKREIKDIKNMDHVILGICFAESYFSRITPYKVAIDEAIELSREYSDEKSAIFLSGVLGSAFDNNYKNNLDGK